MCLGAFERLLCRHDSCFWAAQQRGNEGAKEAFVPG